MLDFEDLFIDGAPAKKKKVSVRVKTSAKAKIAIKPPTVIAKLKTAARTTPKPRPAPPPKPKQVMRPSDTKAPIRLSAGIGTYMGIPVRQIVSGAPKPARARPKAFVATAIVKVARRLKTKPVGQRRTALRQALGKVRAKVRASKPFTHKGDAHRPRKKPSIMETLRAKGRANKERARAKLRARFQPKAKTKHTKKAAPWLGQLKRKVSAATSRAQKASSPNLRLMTATALGTRIVKKVAKKPPPFFSRLPGVAARKAVAAIKPIAHACKCSPPPVIRAIDAQMACQGYPPGSAKNLLAAIHDMNTALEKAAIQRLATHEHNTLSAQQQFEKRVLEKLSTLSRALPQNHPTRTRAHLKILKRA